MSDSIVMLKRVRLAFPTLEKAQQVQKQGDPKFSAVLIFEKGSENHKACAKAIKAAAVEKWGAEKAEKAVDALTKTLKVAMYDGELKADKYDGFEGNMAVNTSAPAKAPPRLLDRDRSELPRDTPKLYAGCYVNASIQLWAQDNQYGKRINATLRGVQFCEDGDAFGGSRPASADEFDALESPEANNDDFI